MTDNGDTAHPAPAAGLDPADAAALLALAGLAGVLTHWDNAQGQPQALRPEVAQRVLSAMGIACANAAEIQASHAHLGAQAHAPQQAPVLITAELGLPVQLSWPAVSAEALTGAQTGMPHAAASGHPYRIVLEDGSTLAGTAWREPDKGEDAWGLPAVEVAGYHTLQFDGHESVLAVAPRRCYGVADALQASGRDPQARLWGTGVQIYSLRHGIADAQRTPSGSGSGDFTTLLHCCTAAAQAGADAVAVNPVHAGFSADPERYSPYAPSSRLFLNPLYIDPAAVFGTSAAREAASALGLLETLQQLDTLAEIDWPRLGRARLAILRRLFLQRATLLDETLLAQFAQFCADGGDALHRHACFEALHHFHAYDGTPAADWREWPAGQRDPASAEVAAFAQEHAEEVAFHQCLQWLAALGLSAAQRSARSAGMAIGLIADLAVGTDAAGSHAWTRQDEIFEGLEVGAPPDVYNPLGQAWGISAFSPLGLRRHGYRAFIEMLRAVLAHAGGLRIDHALGLGRLWLIPKGSGPAEGAYLRFPFDDMMRLIALESWRGRAIIIGENLGTVPAGFNQRLAASGMLGISVMWFEQMQHHGARSSFAPPQAWSPDAIATTTTHDLPSVAGWWAGRDLEWRERLNLFEAGYGWADASLQREVDRLALWDAFVAAGAASGPCPGPDSLAPVQAALAFIGSTPAQLAIAPIEDLLAAREQPNIPGTTSGHPNWQRRLSGDISDCLREPAVAQRIAALAAARSSTP